MRTRWLALGAVLLVIACKKTETVNDTTGGAMTDTTASTSSTPTTSSAAAATLSDADKEFVMKAAQGGMAEVALGNVAAQKGTDAGVKSFGTRMVDDHGKANDELKTLAANKGLTLPAEPDADSKKTQDELSKKSGKAFDKAYMQDMVKDHEKDVAEFEKQSTAAQDPDLKAWVTKTLPTLQDHLKMAKETVGKLK